MSSTQSASEVDFVCLGSLAQHIVDKVVPVKYKNDHDKQSILIDMSRLQHSSGCWLIEQKDDCTHEPFDYAITYDNAKYAVACILVQYNWPLRYGTILGVPKSNVAILREERNIQQAIESMEISEWNDQFAQLEGKSPTSTPKMYSGMINTGIANDSGKYPLEKTEESIPKPQKIEPIKNVAHVGLIKIQKSFISRTLIFTYSDSTSFKETVKISLFSSVQTKRQATKRILQLLMQAPRVLQVMTSSTLDKILQVAKVNGLNVQAQAVLANKRIISIID